MKSDFIAKYIPVLTLMMTIVIAISLFGMIRDLHKRQVQERQLLDSYSDRIKALHERRHLPVPPQLESWEQLFLELYLLEHQRIPVAEDKVFDMTLPPALVEPAVEQFIPTRLDWEINEQGELWVADREPLTTLDAQRRFLDAEAKRLQATAPLATVEIVIRAHSSLPYARVADFTRFCRLAGFENVTVRVSPAEATTP